ncbi:MAG: hypothetical protein C0490_01630 [Marivirga sp.]|nr:hypothetical protein [Marivirga sp.]
MNSPDTQLWRQIKNFELDDEDSQLSFTDRLARENGWSYEFSVRAIEEYKKFIYLICLSDQPITPSDEVDQVWHLHLIYTNSYWKEFCGNILNREIHHGPTRGGQTEKIKYSNSYRSTFEQYRKVFQEEPPTDIWPDEKIRFTKINFRRICLDKNWVIKKPFK